MSDLRLKRLREEQGLTQGALAERLRSETGHQVWPETISRIERGVNSPSAWMAEGLARILGTTVDYILGLTDDPAPQPAPVRSSAQLVINEAQPAYVPMTREVAQLAARLNRLPAAPRAKIIAAFGAVVELSEELAEATAAAEAPNAASLEAEPAAEDQPADPAQRARTARLIRLLDQLSDADYQQFVTELDALLAAAAATASPASVPARRVAGTRSGA